MNNIYGNCDTNNTNTSAVNLSEYAKKTYVETQNNLLLKKTGGVMSGSINMDGNSIVNVNDPIGQTDVATKNYVDTVTTWQVSKQGDEMIGDLVMGGNLVKGLPITYPPRDYTGNEAVSWRQARQLVQSKKPIVTIYAESRGNFETDQFQWSFGGIGDKHNDHSQSGYVMMSRGRVIRMGITTTTSEMVQVKITVNGTVQNSHGISKPIGRQSFSERFTTPLELNDEDRINFKTTLLRDVNLAEISNTSTGVGVVSLLIELDL